MFHWNQNSVKNTFLIMAAYISFYSIWNYLFNDIFCFEKKFINFLYYTGIFLVGAHWFGVPFPKLQTFSGILWVIPIDYSVYEKTILCSYYIWYYSINDNIFVFTNSAVKPQKVLFANEPFFRKMVALFFCANITLCIQKKKIP